MAGAGRTGRSLVDGFIKFCCEVARLLPTRVAETWIRSATFAVYRLQAESFGGRSDGKFLVRLEKNANCFRCL
jgi:uncharacterized protein (DUF697 family)